MSKQLGIRLLQISNFVFWRISVYLTIVIIFLSCKNTLNLLVEKIETQGYLINKMLDHIRLNSSRIQLGNIAFNLYLPLANFHAWYQLNLNDSIFFYINTFHWEKINSWIFLSMKILLLVSTIIDHRLPPRAILNFILEKVQRLDI